MTEFVTLILATSTVISHVIIFVVLFILITKKKYIVYILITFFLTLKWGVSNMDFLKQKAI